MCIKPLLSLVTLFLLSGVLVSSQALQGDKVSLLQGPVAGPRTAVTVLGSPHLSQLPSSAKMEWLSDLLSRLEQFRPTIITVEGMSGRACYEMQAFRALTAEATDAFCPKDEEAQQATGLDIPSAYAQVVESFKSWPANPSFAQRRHLAAILLASGDEASATVQWLQLSPQERTAGDGLSPALVRRLNLKEQERNETYQVGVRLAVRLGLQRVYPIDDHSADSLNGFTPAEMEALTPVYKAGPKSFDQHEQEQLAQLRGPADMLTYYRFLNGKNGLREQMEENFKEFLSRETPNRVGRRDIAWWEVRNLRMVANIREAFGPQPGARVLCIVGQAHKPYFDRYLSQMEDVEVSSVAGLLR